jgi:hypothetical protein
MLLAAALLFVGTTVSASGVGSVEVVSSALIQQQSGSSGEIPAKPQQTQTGTPKTGTVAKANPQKVPPFRIKTKENFGKIFFSIQAKKAKLADVAAEIGKLLKIPVILGTSVKQQELTTDFEDYTLEAALKALVPRPVVDYAIHGGGDVLHPGKKEPFTIYLLGEDDKPPATGPWLENKTGGQMVVGMVYDTEEQEKAAAEEKKEKLQVSYSGEFFTLRIYKQFLTDVLQQVADAAHVPFAIVTHDGSQKEIDQVVTWNITAVNFEELVNTWFPNGVRLYWRTDLVNDVSKPLRLTVEDREDVQAGQQNVTP